MITRMSLGLSWPQWWLSDERRSLLHTSGVPKANTAALKSVNVETVIVARCPVEYTICHPCFCRCFTWIFGWFWHCCSRECRLESCFEVPVLQSQCLIYTYLHSTAPNLECWGRGFPNGHSSDRLRFQSWSISPWVETYRHSKARWLSWHLGKSFIWLHRSLLFGKVGIVFDIAYK